MNAKMIEIRDRGTFVPALAVRLCSDPYDWGGRTYPVIHQHLLVNWKDVEPGAVLDVEFLLGEVSAPKQSEAVTNG